jgi:hypothetical protein
VCEPSPFRKTFVISVRFSNTDVSSSNEDGSVLPALTTPRATTPAPGETADEGASDVARSSEKSPAGVVDFGATTTDDDIGGTFPGWAATSAAAAGVTNVPTKRRLEQNDSSIFRRRALTVELQTEIRVSQEQVPKT